MSKTADTWAILSDTTCLVWFDTDFLDITLRTNFFLYVLFSEFIAEIPLSPHAMQNLLETNLWNKESKKKTFWIKNQLHFHFSTIIILHQILFIFRRKINKDLHFLIICLTALINFSSTSSSNYYFLMYIMLILSLIENLYKISD